MAVHPQPVQAPGRVLSTLNVDGTRRWLRPRPSRGRWWDRRRVLAYVLMFVFFAIPYIRFQGKPLILLDLPRREFTLFGTTFLPTETLLFMLGFLSVGITIFLLTALFGRVWCGWGCPQTVYMEFLFRPLERLIEGGPRGSVQIDQQGGLAPRRLLKYAIYLLLAIFLAHTFLAYFVGIDALKHWVTRPPQQHWTSFLVMAGTTLAIFLDFAWFREQTCLVACPYGRLQSVLLDKRSLIVGYDAVRGEPRAKGGALRVLNAGDCVDCTMCVQTCPTGIDIRDGLQMECIHCTQCMDACDAVMAKVGKPLGLIRYSSMEELAGKARRLFRLRVMLYPLALSVALGLFTWNLLHRPSAEITVLRVVGAPYTLQSDGTVVSPIRIKIANRAGELQRYQITLTSKDDGRVVVPIDPFPVPAHATASTVVFFELPRTAFVNGEREVTFTVSDGAHFTRALAYRLVGPSPAPDGGSK